MTTHYLDIRLRDDPEIAPHQIMSALYARLHTFLSCGISGAALTQAARGTIGVSFPEHDDAVPTLGKLLRLHASQSTLEAALQETWLVGTRDYVRLGEVNIVPEGCGYRTVSRVQVKSSSERLQRRAVKRHGYTEEEARARFPVSIEKRSTLPYVTIGSRSTGQSAFRLIIRHGAIVTQACAGEFGTYGLSATATVPWFLP